MQCSGLAFIAVSSDNPFDLFREWRQEISTLNFTNLQQNTMCLATVNKEGRIANRNVLMKEYDENGFIFVTDKRGRKSREVQENPSVAATFVWMYTKSDKHIARQIRIEGNAIQVSRETCQRIYDEERVFAKIRSTLCNQGEEIDWNEHRKKHDQLLDDFLNKRNSLAMPEHYGGFQIVPERMDFYMAWDDVIGDRVVFSKTEGNEWKYAHVAA